MSTDAIRIKIDNVDALRRRCPVLVLKYAGHPYGVDHAAITRLEISRLDLPSPGRVLIVDGMPAIPADRVLFVGTPPVGRFGYRDIRDFGRRALVEAAAVAPRADEVCLTLHGVGFGLDEREAFESELAGIVDAISAGAVGAGLREVTFLERNDRAADRLRAQLARLLPRGGWVFRSRPPDFTAAPDAGRLESVGYDSAEKRHAVVAMPFAETFEDHFHFGIAPSVEAVGFLCERVDKMAYTGNVVSHLQDRIKSATVVVADLTGANPNVYLEVGYAWGSGIPTVLLCQAGEQLRFDVQGQRCLVYGSILDLQKRLTRELTGMYG